MEERNPVTKSLKEFFLELMNINLQIKRTQNSQDVDETKYTHSKVLLLWNFWTLKEKLQGENNQTS